MKNNNLEKKYVDVIAKHNIDGNIFPLAVNFKNHLYEIDKIKYCCRAASLKFGGTGMRYTIVVNGHICFLYNEDNGKWFIDSSI